MPERDIDPSVDRRRLRNILRRIREDHDMRQSFVANAMGWSVSKLIRIESGSVTISLNDLRALLQLYGITDEQYIHDLLEMARRARQRSWLNSYKGTVSDAFLSFLAYEETAARSYSFQPVLVPDLLQTEEYASEVLRVTRGSKDPRRLERLVQLGTIRRERAFSREGRLNLHFLIDESAIRRKVGGPNVMERQIRHLMDLSQHDNLSLRVVPFEVGVYRGIRAPFTVLERNEPDDEAILYLENSQGDSLIREDVSMVGGMAEMAWEEASLALPPNYIELFSELYQYTSAEETGNILESILSDLTRFDRKVDDPDISQVVSSEISVVVYVDDDNEEQEFRLLRRVDQLVQAMGYGDPIDVQLERGSLFRRSRALALQIISSEELKDRLVKVERGLELAGLELRQAQVDHDEAAAVSMLLAEIKEIPRACIRAGSVMLVKYTTGEGPVLLVRTLSQLEIRALDRYPEIQKNPESLLESLATAVDALKPPHPEVTASPD